MNHRFHLYANYAKISKVERGGGMKEIIVVIWALVLGQLVGYIGSAVTSLAYSPVTVAIISAIFGLIVCILPHVLNTKATTSK